MGVKVKNIHLITILLSLIFISCSSEMPPKVVPACEDLKGIDKPEVKITDVVAVMCDFTTSLDDESSKKVIEDAMNIYSMMKNGMHVAYFEVQDGAGSRPFIEHTTVFSAPRQFERENLKIMSGCMGDSLQNKMNNIVSRPKSIDYPQSCISRSFKDADNYFQSFANRDTSKYKFTIIILSDMIEECSTSILGNENVYMKEKNKVSINKYVSNLNSNLNLSYSDLIVVLSSSKSGHDSDFIKNEELENVWHNVFMKLKINHKSIMNNRSFKSTIPRELMKLKIQ